MSYGRFFFAGRIADIASRYEILLDDATYRQDKLTESNLTNFAGPHVWLSRDDPESSFVAIDSAMKLWPTDVFYVQHFTALAGRVQTLLYAGHLALAFETMEQTWASLKASFFLNVEAIRVFMWQLRGRCSAAAIQNPAKTKEASRVAACAIRKLAKEPTPWAQPMANSVRACIELCENNSDGAERYLRLALDGFQRSKMRLFQNATEAKLCELTGDQQSERFQRIQTWFKSQGIANSHAMVSLYYPVKCNSPSN